MPKIICREGLGEASRQTSVRGQIWPVNILKMSSYMMKTEAQLRQNMKNILDAEKTLNEIRLMFFLYKKGCSLKYNIFFSQLKIVHNRKVNWKIYGKILSVSSR